jgi:hypothetical protein
MEYSILGVMTKGEEDPILGISQEGGWVLIKRYLDKSAILCWVPIGDNGSVEVTGDISQLQVYTPPPTSTHTATLSLTPALGTVTGVIWEDWDEDRVIDNGEPRLPNIKITIYPQFCSNGNGTAGYSEDLGVYSFTNLTPGNYCLFIDVNDLPKPAYSWKLTGDGHLSEVQQQLTLSTGEILTLNFGFMDTEF